MSDKQVDSESRRDKAQLKVTRNFREWADVLSTATAVMALISGVIWILEFLSLANAIPPIVLGVITSAISLGIVLYSIVFLYQRQQKQKKLIEEKLRQYEQKFLDQVNSGFSALLEEKIG